MPPPEKGFWLAFGRIAPVIAVREHWRRYAGDEVDKIGPLLREAPEHSPASHYPCPHCEAMLSVFPNGKDSYIAMSRDEYSLCPQIRDLTEQDLRFVSLDYDLFLPRVAEALALEPEDILTRNHYRFRFATFSLGGVRHPVEFVMYPSVDNWRSTVQSIIVAHGAQPCVCITPWHDEECATALRSRHHAYFGAADVLTLLPGGRFQATAPLSTLYRRNFELLPAAVDRPAVPRKGRRFEIAEDSSEVIDRRKKPPKTYRITSRSCRLALDALVAGGADSPVRGMTNKELCEAVWSRTKSSGTWPQRYAPNQFFRSTKDGKPFYQPFYRSLVRFDEKRGIWWLEV